MQSMPSKYLERVRSHFFWRLSCLLSWWYIELTKQYVMTICFLHKYLFLRNLQQKLLKVKNSFCLKISLAHRVHDWHHEIFKGSFFFLKIGFVKIFCNFCMPKWKQKIISQWDQTREILKFYKICIESCSQLISSTKVYKYTELKFQLQLNQSGE